MAIPYSEKILKRDLSKKICDKYTVTEFCQKAQIDRGMFYNHYSNMSSMFVSVVVLQVQRTLRSFNGETMNRMFYRMLTQIKENHIFYYNLLLISKDPRNFYIALRKEFAIAIENYMRPRGAFSVRQIDLVANGVYAIIYNWVIHECKTDIRDIYQCINLLLSHIEKPLKN
ncbi:hypothetical protein PT281_07505 [Lactobacillus sp. ESL0701]|uniref:TetR/AcrR family transcriptional regulator n=1 Tax=Lactobacillus sp. ESL0701 TaxID=2983217 RepID=UPI0023F82254|nr:hypothetical protein [Lactobacillus sp. ESL0701]MDF7673105.1 hypothetical protein [Lactobacillus sp. ESL0701]